MSRWVLATFLLAFSGLTMADHKHASAKPGAESCDHESHQVDHAHVQIGVMDLNFPLTHLVKRIMQDAYVEIGRVPHFISSPPRRSLMLAGGGLLEAELYRVAAVERMYPDLIRVDYPLYTVEAVAYVWDAQLPVSACADLASYRVAVVRGIVLMEQCAEDAAQLIIVSNETALLDLLAKKLIDVALVEAAQGEVLVAPHMPSGVSVLPRALMSAPIYHYVHKHAAEMVKPLAAALRELDRIGELASRKLQWEIENSRAAALPDGAARSTVLGRLSAADAHY